MQDAVAVLVVDDDAGIRATVVDILRSVGHNVTWAEDGEIALERISHQLVQVVVLDVRMPKRDGISLVESLTPAPPPPIILLVSAYEIDQDLRAELGPKIFKHLQKPVPPLNLIEAVSEAAELANASRT